MSTVMRYDGFCGPCGKRSYRDRADARRAAKQIPGTHMTAYRCPAADWGWHLGHLPRNVRLGLGSKRSYAAQVLRRRNAS